MVVKYNREDHTSSNYIQGHEASSFNSFRNSFRTEELEIEKVNLSSHNRRTSNSTTEDVWLDVPKIT